ncbi:VOC family protein [Pseudoxanthomonas suwonensis]|uniref:3-demethylubiquinone-9 3-methyltransferase n=1 Tax=Pseudoxanthomonas suwonensis TaxID=314722 RepID=A0A0E3UMP5_9GAMM|nr:VOC family protein [Pseudoxanthomonas suwonensis]AKC86511.1 3-demethylubiquinone-9 3-methyltransferase [Pseudoxanthomonas suwonensis]
MPLNTYLSFDGDCRQALESYAALLGGKAMAMMTFGEMPPSEECPEPPAAVKERIMHGCIDIGGHLLMGTDATPDHPYAGITGSYISFQTGDTAEAERVFAALADGAKRIEMPLQPTFWAKRYGSLVDRHGVPWMVNCSDPCPED